MKIGIRKPSIKKSIKARTTGKFKRKLKKAINPMYEKKGVGMITNPKKALYNKVYNKTTIGVSDIVKIREEKPTNVKLNNAPVKQCNSITSIEWKVAGVIMKILAVITAVLFGLPGLFASMFPLLIIAIMGTIGFWKLGSYWSKKAIEVEEEQSAE